MALTFYTNKLIPATAAGCVRVFLIPVIFIKPEYREDKGLLAHEQQHVDQAWDSFFPPLHALLYTISKDYRLECEIEGYRTQLRVNKETGFRGGRDYTETYADFICNDYGLNVNRQHVIDRLKTT